MNADLDASAHGLTEKERKKIATLKWRSKNADRVKATAKTYYELHREELLALARQRYAKNKDKRRAYTANYRANNSEKARASCERYHKEHADKISARAKQYRLENAERIRIRTAAYRESHKTQTRLSRKKWAAANKSLFRIYNNNRRATKAANGGVLSKGLTEKLFKAQKGKCACCGLPLGKKYHLDHIMPLALGGKNEDCNMQLLRQRCNAQKNTKHPVDFMQLRGYLL